MNLTVQTLELSTGFIFEKTFESSDKFVRSSKINMCIRDHKQLKFKENSYS